MTNRLIPIRIARAVRAQYASPNRFYHNLNHLDHLFSVETKIFEKFAYNEVIANDGDLPIIANEAYSQLTLAVLFHDVEYNIWLGSPYNENDSALMLENVYGEVLMDEGEWSQEDISTVAQMIRTTAYHNKDNSSASFMEKLMLDIDISNFAESLDVCKYNQEQIYLEFQPRFPDKNKFLAGNVSFLESLLDRPTLYYTPMFADKEAQARQNIEAMIKGS